MARRAADVARDVSGLGAEAISFETKRDQAVVVRPDRAVLIGIRIVGRMFAGQRAYAPARIHVGRHQPRHHARGAVRRDDAGPQQMAGIGGDRHHLPLFAVQHVGVETGFLVPEGFVELLEQRRGLLAQARGAIGLAQRIEHLGHADPGVVDIALQFAQRLGSAHRRPVGIDHGIAGIFPGHVLIADRRAGLVLLEHVAVAVAVVVDPVERGLGVGQVSFQQRVIAGRAPGGVQRDQIQRRGVGGAVIRRVRDQLEVREFTVTKLVHDLAGFGVAEIIAFLRLPAAQHIQRSAREFRIDQYVLQRNDQAVAAERRHEPGQPGGGQEHHVVGALDRQAQRRHVVDRLVEEAIEFLVAGTQFQHRLPPIAVGLGLGRSFGVHGAIMGRVIAPVAVGEFVQQATVPLAAGRQPDLETQAAVGEHGARVALADRNGNGAGKVDVAVGGAQGLARLRPVGVDVAAADVALGLDVEHVGEIGTDRDLQVEPHRFLAVVGDVQVLVQALIHHAGQSERQRLPRDRAVLGEKPLVGQEDAGGVETDRAAVDQFPGRSVRVDRPGADQPGVEKIQPFVAGPVDLPVRFGDQDRHGLMDGDLRRADLDLERHERETPRLWCAPAVL